MRLSCFCAAIENVDALGWFFASFWFWTWETTVTRCNTSEAALTPSKFGSASLLDSLHCVQGVLTSRGAVSLDLTWSLHHNNTSAISPQRSGIYALRNLNCQHSAHCVGFRGMLLKLTSPPLDMEEAALAFVFFWLAGLLAVIGFMLAFFSKAKVTRRISMSIFLIGFLSILATPWTIPFSSSSAFGHLLGSLLGPCVLLAVGFYHIGFSGNVPVGRLPKQDKITGFAMVIIGFLWLEAMHWWQLTPTYPDDVNRYWMIYWPTFLLFAFACCTGGFRLLRQFQEGKQREQRLLAVLSLLLLNLIVVGVLLNGPHVMKEDFTAELLLAASDLFGVLVGTALAIVIFALVLFVYERQRPLPPTLLAPSTEQLEHAARIISQHVNGGEEE